MFHCKTNCGVQLVLLVLAGLGLSQQAAIDSNFYTAGVVEFRPSAIGDISDNLAGYVEIIQSVNASETDIIVFPEATLNGLDTASFVPDPAEAIIPCLTDPEANYYGEFMVQLSCAARNVSKYVVINLSERQLCSDTPEDPRPCAPNGYNIYNTNAVFDRTGAVVSRYRKVHLYGEPRNSTYLPESITFETDFNVTFGHFICFDILFYEPAQKLIVEQDVKDFLFPSMWFSQLPFLTAVQVQQGWAYVNDVNLLAAGSSFPAVGSSGSGIYHGSAGTISSVMTVGGGERRLYVAQVPKYVKSETREKQRRSRRSVGAKRNAADRSVSSEDFRMKRDYLQNYETVALDLQESQANGKETQEVCHGQICCNFELEWEQIEVSGTGNDSQYYSYRLGAYDGWRNEQSVDANYIRNCGIFSCTGPTIADCGQLLNDELQHQPRVAFNKLQIEATYPKSSEFLLMPNSLQDNLLPLEPPQFQWSVEELKNENEVKVRYTLAESVELKNLLTFAIYGNYFDDECTFGTGTEEEDLACGFKPVDDGAAELRSAGFGLILLLTLLITFPFN